MLVFPSYYLWISGRCVFEAYSVPNLSLMDSKLIFNLKFSNSKSTFVVLAIALI